jgi:hypothetical protein
METKQAELELSVIKKIMEDSKSIVCNNGWHYIFWGLVVSAALIANYIIALMNIPQNYAGFMWFVTMIGAAIGSMIWGRRKEKQSKVKTFAGRLLGSLWFAGGISMFMFGFVGTISGAYNAIFICPIISTVLGVTYFASGEIQQLKWQKALSFGWWAGAILLFFFPSVHTLLIFAVMLILFQTIPGIILNKRYKKELSSGGTVQV